MSRSPKRLEKNKSGNKASEVFFTGVGNYQRKITTTSVLAQQYFDQGFAFLYGFNHAQAIRSFEAAAANDPDCGMAFWGIAMANGPHINDMTVDRPRANAAWEAFKRARDLLPDAAPVERALIEAVGKRYADPPPVDRRPLDEAYAAAMRDVWKTYPNDADVGALTAEALLDLQPWNQWTVDGKAQPGTDEILRILGAVLAGAPQHPFALHLLIHTVEASPHPEMADAAADRLRDFAPALEHLLHMPSHIDVRRGRWQEAVVANEKAIAAEKAYQHVHGRQVVNTLWPGHNYHMLAYAAMMQGQSKKAMDAVHEMLSGMEGDVLEQPACILDLFFAMPYELHMRFGRWDAMLAEPQPRASLPVTTALWRYGRGVSFAATNQIERAKAERKAFLAARRAVPANVSVRYLVPTSVLDVAEKMLAGEILYREAKIDDALAALREAVRLEDKLLYMEPPSWTVPVRHALGATLMDADRYAEAEAVYRDDLRRYPENGWSLYGLGRSLRMQGKKAEAAEVAVRFEKAWRYADVKLSSSCCCLPGRD